MELNSFSGDGIPKNSSAGFCGVGMLYKVSEENGSALTHYCRVSLRAGLP